MLESLTGCLKIKLGASLTGPTKRLAADLHHIAGELNRVRNAMLRAWLRWREDHTDWQPPHAVDDNDQPRTYRDGSPVLVCPWFPVRVPHPDKPDEEIGFRTWLYHVGRRTAPDVSTALISSCSGEVESWLKAKMPHNHWGKARHRWQAVLTNEIQLASWREIEIPVPNNAAALVYRDATNGKGLSKAELATARHCGNSASVLAFPLWSASAGRRHKVCVSRIETRQLSPGNKHLVERIAAGTWKFRDSKLTFIRGQWCLLLSYEQPTLNLGLDAARVATLWPNLTDARSPFLLEFGNRKPWGIGDGLALQAKHFRLKVRRESLQHRHTVAGPGSRGHGRRRTMRDYKAYSRSTRDAQDGFVWHAIRDIRHFCKERDCGVLLFREPGMGLRQSDWFGSRDIPFDWTGFLAKLQFKLRQDGIEVVVERVSKADWREHFGLAPVGRVHDSPQDANGNSHALRPAKQRNGRRVLVGR